MEQRQLLVDYIPFHVAKLSLIESKENPSDKRMRVKGKLQEADVKNGNGRVYPLEILKKQVDEYIKGPVASKTATGELDHPESSVINLNNVSHLITKVWWEGNDVMGELILLNTPSGKIAQEINAYIGRQSKQLKRKLLLAPAGRNPAVSLESNSCLILDKIGVCVRQRVFKRTYPDCKVVAG